MILTVFPHLLSAPSAYFVEALPSKYLFYFAKRRMLVNEGWNRPAQNIMEKGTGCLQQPCLVQLLESLEQ